MEDSSVMGNSKLNVGSIEKSKLSGTKTGKKRLRTLLIVLAVALVLILLIGGYIVSQMLSPTYETNITSIEVTAQQASGVTITNYVPVLSDNVDWGTLSDADRAGTARYAVNQAIDQATANGITSYNVLGMTDADRTAVFFYSGGADTVTLYIGGESTSIPLDG